MKIKLIEKGISKELKLDSKARVDTLISDLKLNDETFLIKLNGKIAHEQTSLKEGDELEFLDVIYGG
ncbi:MoaD/ThiS family protein [Candidatus Micrarchaeota archaeon]|nr:MoaD/ThiS family protein [Candidatus Micrarchaeota archaeon]